MPRSKEQIEDLIDEVSSAYARVFKEQVARGALLGFALDMFTRQQLEFLESRLGHLPPDDVVVLRDVLAPPPTPPVTAPAPNVLTMQAPSGRPKKR